MRILMLLCGLAICRPAACAELQFNFGDLAASGSLTNFHSELFGGGGPVSWRVLAGEAPSAFAPLSNQGKSSGGGGALAQTSQNPTDERYPMYIYDGEKFRDFRFSTQFKAISGLREQMAGLVFRFQNTSNFYVARVSVLGKNIRFYKVVDGVRSDPIGPACAVEAGSWHQLAVQCDGNQIMLWLDGRLVMPALGDNTFAEGKIGFWTKSDAVSYFANAVVDYTPVVPPAQSVLDSLVREQPRILGLRIYTAGPGDTTSVVASKDPSEVGQAGGDAELAAIRDGTVSYGRQSGAVFITMPLHDRNGEFIAAVRFQLKSFWGETQDNAVGRAMILQKLLQGYGLSANDLKK